MQKVIPGSSRETLAFIGQHWKNLLLMSLVPAICQMVVSYWQIKQMANLYRSLGALGPDSKPEAIFTAGYFSSMGWSFLGSILVYFLLAMLFSQVVRYRKGAAASLLPLDQPSWKAAAMTAVYAIGITMLTLLAYIVVVLVGSIAGAIIGGVLSFMGSIGAVLGVLLFVAMIAGIVGFLLWFFFRFAVGLPGVALGHSPDFFKDLWTLAKGEGWAVPLRVLMAIIVAYIPLGLLIGTVMAPSLVSLVDNPALKENPENPLVVMPIIADMFEKLAPTTVVSSLLMMPFNWFGMVLLAVCFDRFLGRVQQKA